MSRKHHTVLHRPLHRSALASGFQVKAKHDASYRAEQERWHKKQKRKAPRPVQRKKLPRSIPALLDACRIEKTITDILWACELNPYYGYGVHIGGDINIGDFFHVTTNGVTQTYQAKAGRHGGIDYSAIERRVLQQIYRSMILRGRSRAFP